MRRSSSGSPSPLAQIGLTVSVVGLLLLEIYAVFVAQHGTPSSGSGADQYLVGEIAGETRVSQTMTLGADGFDRVTFRVAPHGTAGVSGTAIVEVKELVAPDAEVVIYRVLRPASELAEAGRASIEFPAIAASKGRRFRVEIRVPDAMPGQGLALRALREDTYSAGALFIGSREQWGDLVFETGAAGATLFARLAPITTGKPGPFGSPAVFVLLFVLLNVALVAMLRLVLLEGGRAPAPKMVSNAP